ncbi:hypothetical protein [Methylocystis sp.]|uniref:hypothetical protein n=1 Tax=Methylocystis sp. TaxID=1911079 RepID=UPI003DA5B306
MNTQAVAADLLLFDDWNGAIEEGVRAKVRNFIDATLEEEMAAICGARAMDAANLAVITSLRPRSAAVMTTASASGHSRR